MEPIGGCSQGVYILEGLSARPHLEGHWVTK